MRHKTLCALGCIVLVPIMTLGILVMVGFVFALILAFLGIDPDPEYFLISWWVNDIAWVVSALVAVWFCWKVYRSWCGGSS